MTDDDLVPEFFVDDVDVDEPPLPFKVTYVVDGEKQTDVFHALPASQVPYAWVLDFFAAGAGDQVAQSAATIAFFDRVLIVDDRPRFRRLVDDGTTAVVTRKNLEQILVYLLSKYNEVDPTRARSAGQKRSPSGRSSNGPGSKGRRSEKGSTSP